MPNKTSKIIICHDCNGSGKNECNELADYHHNVYNYWDIKCETCDGHGRLLETTLVSTRKLTNEDFALRPKSED